MPPFQHRPHRSNVRTRSQQHQPIVPVDLTASPLKAVRRQNRTATAPAGTSMPHLQQNTTTGVPALNTKRSPSPSSTSRLDDCKRQRVSIERDEKETEPSTSSQPTPIDPTLTGTPRPPLIHVNLSRISQSPFKPVSSPLKMFKITTHTEGTVEVPVTPARRQTLNPGDLTETNRSRFVLSEPNVEDDPELPLPATEDSSGQAPPLNINNDTIPAPQSCHGPAVDSNPTSSMGNSVSHPSKATVLPAPSTIKKPESFIQFKTPLRPRETVVPGTSRLPRPSSSLKVSLPSEDATKTPARMPNPMAATISSLAKVKPRASPMRLRSRPQMKMKLGIKDKTPTSKLALKRSIRRTSLNKEKIKGAPLPSTKPPGAFAAFPVKGGKQTTLKGFFQQRSVKSGRDTEGNSPSKPTPLVALSTALKKLEVSAPLPPPRPAVKNVVNIPATQPAVDEAAVASESLEGSSDVCERTIGAAENLKTTPKARLPMRLPSNFDIEGRTHRAPSDSPTNRKSSISRTTPPPIDLSDPDNEPIPTQNSLEILDVDTWADGAKEEQKENKPPIEFFVPLADEPSTTAKLQALSQISPSRRASQASLALSESLNRPQIFPQARSVSASHLQLNARSPVKTRGKAKPLPPSNETANQTNGRRLNARMPGSLDVLKNCVIYVDVRTEEGEDAAPLFVDMLRGLGARILSKPGKSCTHLVFKAGLPSTVVKYKLLPQPKPLVVSIGWVVECVEKRSHVEETKFQVNLDDIDVTGGLHRRRSMTMQPKPIKALISGQSDPGDSGDSSLNGDTSFTSEGSSTTGLGLLNNLSPPQRSTVMNNLPPLERARQRSQRLPRMK